MTTEQLLGELGDAKRALNFLGQENSPVSRLLEHTICHLRYLEAKLPQKRVCHTRIQLSSEELRYLSAYSLTKRVKELLALVDEDVQIVDVRYTYSSDVLDVDYTVGAT